MVRRCMEGSRCFGMGTVNRQHQLSDVSRCWLGSGACLPACPPARLSACLLHPATCPVPWHRRGVAQLHAFVLLFLASPTPAQVACEAEITECNPLPDGRYYIEVRMAGAGVGRRGAAPKRVLGAWLDQRAWDFLLAG